MLADSARPYDAVLPEEQRFSQEKRPVSRVPLGTADVAELDGHQAASVSVVLVESSDRNEQANAGDLRTLVTRR
jgi:hypothetical protein